MPPLGQLKGHTETCRSWMFPIAALTQCDKRLEYKEAQIFKKLSKN